MRLRKALHEMQNQYCQLRTSVGTSRRLGIPKWEVDAPVAYPDATDAGYPLAKLRRPRIAALRSSRSVALCSRPHSVAIVSVAVCFAGAWDSSIRNIVWRGGS